MNEVEVAQFHIDHPMFQECVRLWPLIADAEYKMAKRGR
jgi:hypothetical protein